jgi:hypothetical protein
MHFCYPGYWTPTYIFVSLLFSYFLQAKIVIDLYVNGLERATLEGILFDAYPIISSQDNGLDSHDFNLPDFAKVDPLDPNALVKSISFVIEHYDTDEMRAAYRPFKEFVLSLRATSAIESSLIFQTSRRYQYQICTKDFSYNSPAALLGALSLFQRHPLSSIEIVVPSQNHALNSTRDVGFERYLRRHSPLLKKLQDFGLTNTQGGSIHHSLRIRGSHSSDPNIPSVVHGDYLIFADEPIMTTDGFQTPDGFRYAKFVEIEGWFLDFNNATIENARELLPSIGAVKNDRNRKQLVNQLSDVLPLRFFQYS